jgi:hypothetical protein
MSGRLFGLSTLSGQNGAQYTVDFFFASARQQSRGIVPAIDIQCTSALYGSCMQDSKVASLSNGAESCGQTQTPHMAS